VRLPDMISSPMMMRPKLGLVCILQGMIFYYAIDSVVGNEYAGYS
jgi:hypothetical protein